MQNLSEQMDIIAEYYKGLRREQMRKIRLQSTINGT